MTIRTRRPIKLVTRHSSLVTALLITLLAVVGCSQQPPSEAPAVLQAAVEIAPQPVAPLEPAPQPPAQVPPAPPPPAPTFAFSSDLTGQALPRVVAPAAPAKLPGERFGGEPKPRAVPAKYLDPNPTAQASYTLPPVFPAKPAATKPVAPPEKVPLDLGAGAGTLPAKLVLPVAPVVTERARDVNIPPPAPVLGRQGTDRVPFEDPTTEVGNVVVVAGAVPVPLGVSGFLKITVPDPFELGAQVKPNVPPAAEPSAQPVPVNPQRVK